MTTVGVRGSFRLARTGTRLCSVSRTRSAETAMSNERMQYGGVNHVALVARDMAETVDFYENVLEMPLVKTVEFDCGGGGTLAFFWFPDAPPIAPGVASMHEDVRKHGSMTAIASMNHLAISI